MARRNQKWIIDRHTKKLVKVQDVDNYENRVHHIMPDIAEYQSPVSLRMVNGRTQRREDMKVTGCREVDPSERPAFNNYKDGRNDGIQIDREQMNHEFERLGKMSDEQVMNERRNRAEHERR